jgi:hypothetical protein
MAASRSFLLAAALLCALVSSAAAARSPPANVTNPCGANMTYVSNSLTNVTNAYFATK